MMPSMTGPGKAGSWFSRISRFPRWRRIPCLLQRWEIASLSDCQVCLARALPSLFTSLYTNMNKFVKPIFFFADMHINLLSVRIKNSFVLTLKGENLETPKRIMGQFCQIIILLHLCIKLERENVLTNLISWLISWGFAEQMVRGTRFMKRKCFLIFLHRITPGSLLHI